MKRADACVFILLGQSNAVGHALPMEERDITRLPLKNVFGLSRDKNQNFNLEKLCWQGYTTYGMNLGEEQDNTYSVANCLAIEWQKRIDNGENLPDLYIVHIAIGAQGVTKNYMWYPYREPVLKPGRLGEVDISLHPFTVRILSLIKDSFEREGKTYEILDINWRGGENDATEDYNMLRGELKNIYVKMLKDYISALGEPLRITLNKIVAEGRMNFLDPTGGYLKSMEYVNGVFDELCSLFPDCETFDVKSCPLYNSNAADSGLFMSDLVHFTRGVNEWVAEEIIKKYKQGVE